MMIDDMVYGHLKAKKVLEAVINRSQKRYNDKVVGGSENFKNPLNCLLVGQSGTGKTHLIKSYSKLYNFPLLTLTATELTPTGSHEGINSKQLRALITKTANEYLKKPEYHSLEGVLSQMIVFVDEFDKLGVSFESTGNWNKQIQACFLTLIEEDLGVSWVFAGAFSNLYVPKRRSIGFFNEEKEVTTEFGDAMLLGSGIIPEMLGRIPLIVQLDTFNKQDYLNILTNNLLPKYDLEDLNLDQIAEKALTSGQGIRSLTRQLEMLTIEQEEPLCLRTR